MPFQIILFTHALGVLCILNAVQFSFRIFWFTDYGINGRAGVMFKRRFIELPFANLIRYSPPRAATILFLLAVGGLSLALGFFLLLSSLLCLLSYVILIQSNPKIFFGADSLIVVSLLLLFLLSITHSHAVQSQLPWGTALDSQAGLLALRLNVVSHYLYGSLWKLYGDEWRSGVALGKLLGPRWWGSGWISNSLLFRFSRLIPYILMGIPILLFIPDTHLLGILVALIFHILVRFTIGIPLYGLVMSSSLVLFLNTADLHSLSEFFSF